MRRWDEEEEEEGQAGVTIQEATRGEARGVGGEVITAVNCSCSAFQWKVAAETGSLS